MSVPRPRRSALSQPIPPFRIKSIERVSFGSKRATFVVDVPGLGRIDCEFFDPPNGEPFVAPRSVRARHGDEYQRTIVFEGSFAEAVLTALAAAAHPTKGAS